jgi:hypothetical protein
VLALAAGRARTDILWIEQPWSDIHLGINLRITERLRAVFGLAWQHASVKSSSESFGVSLRDRADDVWPKRLQMSGAGAFPLDGCVIDATE